MMRLILLILAAFPSQAALVLSQTTGSYNWSNTAAWVGGAVPTDGDFAVWRSTGTLTIDANIGTSGGGGIKTIRIENGTVTVDTTAARTITFGSTGTDPIGSGTNRNPGADATMHGFFVARGTLNLVGTQANPVTVTTANGSSPTYIHHDSLDFTGCTTFTANVCNGSGTTGSITLNLQWADLYRLGANVSKYQGIYLGNSTLTGSPTVTISHNRFTSPYNALYLLASTPSGLPITVTYNYVTGNQTNGTFFSEANMFTALTFTDNTEDGGAVDGYLLRLTSEPQGAVISRNAAYGNVANRGVMIALAASTGTGGNVFADNLCVSPKRTATLACLFPQLPAADTTTTIYGTVSAGLLQGVSPQLTSGATVEVYNNWSTQYIDAWNGQGGIIITYNASGVSTSTFKVHNNVVSQEDGDGTHGNFAILAYTTGNAGGSANTVQMDHNSAVGMITGNSTSWVMGLGEFGTGTSGNIKNAYFRSNIVHTSSDGGGAVQIADGNSHNTWDAGVLFQSAGVHHNATYGATASYSNGTGTASYTTNFDNGTTHHPNALYGDVTTNPRPFAASRRPWTWASWMGGTGTSAYLMAELAKRSGWGGAYNIAISSNPIQDMRLWLFEGFAPTNLDYKGVAHDAGDIGAVTITKFNTPGGIGSAGASF